MPREHHYAVSVEWTGNTGQGTANRKSYDRTHRLLAEGKPEITGSADPAFSGNSSYWNPEDLLLVALSACHKLWYLHLCAEAGITVIDYRDDATAKMLETRLGGQFQEAILRPKVGITRHEDLSEASALHERASERCFIKNSVNFPVHHQAEITVQEPTGASRSKVPTKRL